LPLFGAGDTSGVTAVQSGWGETVGRYRATLLPKNFFRHYTKRAETELSPQKQYTNFAQIILNFEQSHEFSCNLCNEHSIEAKKRQEGLKRRKRTHIEPKRQNRVRLE